VPDDDFHKFLARLDQVSLKRQSAQFTPLRAKDVIASNIAQKLQQIFGYRTCHHPKRAGSASPSNFSPPA
jgi:hypothetical protein